MLIQTVITCDNPNCKKQETVLVNEDTHTIASETTFRVFFLPGKTSRLCCSFSCYLQALGTIADKVSLIPNQEPTFITFRNSMTALWSDNGVYHLVTNIGETHIVTQINPMIAKNLIEYWKNELKRQEMSISS